MVEPLALWPDESVPGGPNDEGLPRLTPYLVGQYLVGHGESSAGTGLPGPGGPHGHGPGGSTGSGGSARPLAAVVVCPGGGYARRAPHEGEPVARWLNSLGLHAFVLDYRVAPGLCADWLVELGW